VNAAQRELVDARVSLTLDAWAFKAPHWRPDNGDRQRLRTHIGLKVRPKLTRADLDQVDAIIEDHIAAKGLDQ
jgi:hypothetical protein